jgi:hypothetical protein
MPCRAVKHRCRDIIFSSADVTELAGYPEGSWLRRRQLAEGRRLHLGPGGPGAGEAFRRRGALSLRPAILQNDARAAREIRFLADAVGHLDLVALTGSALTQQSVAPMLLWLARHEPDTWERVSHVLGSYDWLATALGARPHVETN